MRTVTLLLFEKTHSILNFYFLILNYRGAAYLPFFGKIVQVKRSAKKVYFFFI